MKKLFLALATVLAAAFLARCAVELLNNYLARRVRANHISMLSGFTPGAVRFFLNSLETLGIETEDHSDAELADCMVKGFYFKFTEVKSK
jgi:hypothetical protein